MAITILQTAQAVATSVLQLTATFPGSVTAGSTVIAIGGAACSPYYGSTMHTTNSGTQVVPTALGAATTSTGNRIDGWYRTTVAGDSATWTFTNNFDLVTINMWLFEIAGLDTSTLAPITVANNSIIAALTNSTGSLTPTASKGMFLLAVTWAQGGNFTTGTTPTSGFTMGSPATAIRSLVAYNIVASSSGSYNVTFNWLTNSRPTGAFLVGFYGAITGSSTLMMTGSGG